MSVAEKLLTIAENSRDMYLLAESKKATVSGGVAKVDNVSSYGHSLGVKLSSDTITDFSGIEVSRFGKNLLPYPYYRTTRTENGITFTDNKDGSITLNGTCTLTSNVSDYLLIYQSNPIRPGTYILSGCPKGGQPYTYRLFLHIIRADGSPSYVSVYDNGVPFEINEGDRINTLSIRIGYQLGKVENLTFYPQLEAGTTATEYEPYKAPQTATANADGTVNGLTSLSPNITLIPDNADVSVECTYYTNERDPILEATENIKTALVELKENL